MRPKSSPWIAFYQALEDTNGPAVSLGGIGIDRGGIACNTSERYAEISSQQIQALFRNFAAFHYLFFVECAGKRARMHPRRGLPDDGPRLRFDRGRPEEKAGGLSQKQDRRRRAAARESRPDFSRRTRDSKSSLGHRQEQSSHPSIHRRTVRSPWIGRARSRP